MPFLFPGLLALGVIAGVPIIIHLLNRQRYQRVQWAAMRFLLDALRDETKKIRYRDLLLMILRAVACLLLVMAIARPVSRFLTDAVGWGSETRSVVLVLDDSASMHMTSGTETVFERVKREALSICRELPSGTVVSVITASRPVGVVIEGSSDLEEVVELIESLKPTHGGTDFAGAVRKAAKLSEEVAAGRAVELFVLTDLQARVLKRDAESLRDLAGDFRTGSNRYLVPLGLAGQNNLAVTDLSAEMPVVTVGEPLAVEAEVTNGGAEAENNVVVELLLDGEKVGAKVIARLGPGESVTRRFYVETDTPGERLLEAVVERARGRLAVDDVRTLVIKAVDNVSVLLVDGEPGKRFGEGEVDYLDAMLNPDVEYEGKLVKGAFTTKTIDAVELTPDAAADAEIVVLANVPSIRADVAIALEKRVREGTALMIFLGDRVVPEDYNGLFEDAMKREEERLAAEKKADEEGDQKDREDAERREDDKGIRPLIPAFLGEIVEGVLEQTGVGEDGEDEDDWFCLSAEYLNHPWMQFFNTKQTRDYLRVPVRKAYTLKVERTPWASVVARYTDGNPAIVEQRLGEGRVILVGTSADLEWNDLHAEPAGPILIKRMVTALIPGSDVRKSVDVGTRIRISIPQDERKLPMKLVTPDEKVQTVKPEMIGGRFAVVYQGNGPAGVYRVKIDSVPPREELFSLNVEADESDVTTLTESDVKDLFPSDEFIVLKQGRSGSVGKALRKAKIGMELWWPVLLLGLLVFVTELVLGRLFTMQAPSSDDVPKIARRGRRVSPAGAAVARGREG